MALESRRGFWSKPHSNLFKSRIRSPGQMLFLHTGFTICGTRWRAWPRLRTVVPTGACLVASRVVSLKRRVLCAV